MPLRLLALVTSVVFYAIAAWLDFVAESGHPLGFVGLGSMCLALSLILPITPIERRPQ